ncbi:MAG: trypsin-like peptidase domain-containing protein, partial [Candidatus Yanofskybacteria bacterium]|nr:trypsin-like peptidase domain-containing protein [Candidatus Yanofskybacteria bacterium]
MFNFFKIFNIKFSKNGKNDWRILVFLNVVISAVVGAFFGYYGASLIEPVADSGGTFIRQISNQVFKEEEVVVDVAKKSSPAVVSIIATKDLVILQQRRGSIFEDFCSDPFFRQFFGPAECATPVPQAPKTQRRQVSAGSGFVVSSDGLVVTNKHVVDIDKADFTVLTKDGEKYPAEILAKDSLHDLAVLKISGNKFPT